jgi:hypothetical protein
MSVRQRPIHDADRGLELGAVLRKGFPNWTAGHCQLNGVEASFPAPLG